MPNTTNEWEEELKDFEMIMPDGFYKYCLFYHESTKTFIEHLLASERAKLIKKIEDKVRKETICEQCSDRIIPVLTSLKV